MTRSLCLLSLIAALCAASGHTLAAANSGSIVGRVVDALDAPIVVASLVLVRNDADVATATTSDDGQYAFGSLAPGRYHVRVTAPGFAPRTTPTVFVDADARIRVDVMLSIGPLQQDVVVTAAARELPQSRVGASVTILDRDTLQRLAKPDVLESMRLVPGLQVVQTGQRGGATSVFVRGGNANFDKVMIDGVPANDIGGAFDFATLSTAGVDRVEVLRNPNSVLYGTDALSSVVSITTSRGTTRIPEATLSIDGGRFATSRASASLGGAQGRVDYFAEAVKFDTDNDVPNDAYRNRTIAGRIGWAATSRALITATVRRSDSEQGVPNASGYYGIVDDSSQTNRATYTAISADVQHTDRWHSTARFASSRRRYTFVNPAPTGELVRGNYLGNRVTIVGANGSTATGRAILDFGGTYPQPFESRTTRESAYGQTDYRLWSAIDASAGVRVEHETGFVDSGSRTTTDRTNVGSFVEVRGRVRDRLFVSGGLGVERNAVFGVAATPRVSVAAYVHKSTKLTFNAGTGIKAPSIQNEQRSLYNLLTTLPQGAALISTFGLSRIGPERSRSVDAGIEQEWWKRRARARATVFDNQFDDLIEFVSKNALPQIGVPVEVAAATTSGASVNSSSYRSRGLETSLEAQVLRGLNVIATYTYLHAVVTKSFASGALLPAINPAYPGIPIGAFAPLVGGRPFRRAPHSGSVMASYAVGRLDLSLAGYFVGRQDASTFLTDASFGNSLLLPNHDLGPGYRKFDASGSYKLHPRLRAYFSVENVLGEDYQAALGYPALPRAGRAGVTVTLGGDSRRP